MFRREARPVRGKNERFTPARPAYPDDPAEMAQRSQEDWADYPDMVYQAQEAEEEAFLNPPAIPPETPAYSARRRMNGGWALTALICLGLLCLMVYSVISLRKPYDTFRQKAAKVNQDVIAQGIYVDGVHVGGKTKEQAAQALGGALTVYGGLQIVIRVDDETWVVSDRELPLERNTDAVLDTAYAVGRQGSRDTLATRVTPFEYRYRHLYHTAASPVELHTVVTYDPEKVRELAGVIENRINRDPVDAQVATFDYETRTFTFQPEQPGRKIDGNSLYNQLISALDRRDYRGKIVMNSQPIPAKVTAQQLADSFSLISTYTTQTTADGNRNNNVNLAANAVTNKVVMPGETFSFNQATGQRTAEKGYLPAAAILGGATVDEIGGGVCQVSSTLFNAAAMADMTILKRTPHTWPSNYVEKGRDATVNWPTLDFAFCNDRDTPVFIVAYYRQRECTVEIYGCSLGSGNSITLETQLISVTEPPVEAIYEQNPELPPGTVQEKKKPRTGYVVDTYRVYRHNGVEYRREKLCTSNYQMIQQVIEYN